MPTREAKGRKYLGSSLARALHEGNEKGETMPFHILPIPIQLFTVWNGNLLNILRQKVCHRVDKNIYVACNLDVPLRSKSIVGWGKKGKIAFK